MQKIAKFEKVSFEQFKNDWVDCYPEYQGNEASISDIYNQIKLPKRATTGSAGCDFFSPSNLTIYPKGAQIVNENPFKILNGEIKIPTGIRCWIDSGWLLQVYPRSSLGFKYGIHLANTVGIIDSDYYYSNNEGHIFVKLINDSSLRNTITIEAGQAFCQGIFAPYGVTYDDDVNEIRNGGFGSTDTKSSTD
ncbi:MAG: deoxyuridine 5'-triphosphate nucleotidohydrolase [Eubacterium sp.]|nr:deoxyuridine 5'-triphosphate nucleotidohydrolase [Eubacterium sp.]